MNKLFGEPGYEPGPLAIFLVLFCVVMIVALLLSACASTEPVVYPQRTYHIVLLDGTPQDVVYAWCTSAATAAGTLVVRCYDRDYAWGDPLLVVTAQSIKEIKGK